MPTCADCIWLSRGYQDPKGYGYCYSEEDYVDPDGSCAHWQKSLREEPVNPAPFDCCEICGEDIRWIFAAGPGYTDGPRLTCGCIGKRFIDYSPDEKPTAPFEGEGEG